MKKINSWYIPKKEVHLNSYIEKEDGYQKDCRDHALKFVKNFRTAIDVGSHIGLWSRDLCERFKTVYAFEPIQNHRDCFNKNLKNYNNFLLYPYALGVSEREVAFDYDEKNTGHTRVNEKKTGNFLLKKLDSFYFSDVDFIKLDCEGYEYFALKGSEDTIKRCKPVINIEQKKFTYDSIHQYKACEYLESLGMRFLSRYKDEFVYSF